MVALTRMPVPPDITMGNNGENGAIHSMEKTLDFWRFYGAKYANETHHLEVNEPVVGHQPQLDLGGLAETGGYVQNYPLCGTGHHGTATSASFFGGSQAPAGADGLAEEFPVIDNAGFAFHAYWNCRRSTMAASKPVQNIRH